MGKYPVISLVFIVFAFEERYNESMKYAWEMANKSLVLCFANNLFLILKKRF